MDSVREAARDYKSQLFVRNLSYDVTEDSLITLFEEIGPIKRVGIVVDEVGKSKGYGFVTYALEDDALKAVESFNNHKLNGRAIKVEIAHKKGEKPSVDLVNYNKEAVKKSKPVAKEPTAADSSDQPNDESDGVKRSMQVVVMGLPEDITTKTFKIAALKVVRKAEVSLIKDGHSLFNQLPLVAPKGKNVWISVPARKYIPKLVSALENTTVFNLNLRKPDDAKVDQGRKERLVVRIVNDITCDDALRKRKNRLIIRNLSFQATEENIIDKLSKFGPIVEASIPKVFVPLHSSDDTKQSSTRKRKADKIITENGKEGKYKPRGYGFVTFLCHKDAMEAVKQGTSIKICNRSVPH